MLTSFEKILAEPTFARVATDVAGLWIGWNWICLFLVTIEYYQRFDSFQKVHASADSTRVEWWMFDYFHFFWGGQSQTAAVASMPSPVLSCKVSPSKAVESIFPAMRTSTPVAPHLEIGLHFHVNHIYLTVYQ